MRVWFLMEKYRVGREAVCSVMVWSIILSLIGTFKLRDVSTGRKNN